MEIRVLRYFLEIARQGSMTAAAEVLHISQPALSRQMKELEEELGKKLLEEQSGQPLVFTVASLTVDRGREEVQKLSTASLLREFNLQITDCRPAEDGELGLESLHLTIE